eukprot:TRINITY_DN4867_c0_g1_i1.p1 TRINITY_DN4867_c0_g1~~TRINITY_DN4867_c0_g1_i1.p1  ORF type:complete len:210 (-),score=28.85 TRINITY_DN4867_c0_g1_i1:476-1105(-)
MTYENSDKDYDFLLKVVMIGDSGVGKSCLLKRFSSGEFEPGYISTIGVDFEIRTLTIEQKTVKLQIWDTAGQERFHNITTSYYRGAHCIMLVYDVTSGQSFKNVPRWLNQIKQYGSKDVKVLLVGNKTDLVEKRIVSYNDALDLAKELSLEVMETSAKDATNVDKAFLKIATEALKTRISKVQEVRSHDPVRLDGQGLEENKQNCCVIL